VSERDPTLPMTDKPIYLETPLNLLTTYLTPPEVFFIRHHWNPPIPDPVTWTLTIDGEVAQPVTLTLADLQRMPKTTATCVLECAGNGRSRYRPPVRDVQWTFGAMGNARWSGVRVADLVERVGPKAGARHIHTFGRDTPPGREPPFHRSLELAKALVDCIIAYEMDGRPLPPLHGGPARLVVPGWTGNHWMKWLTRLSLCAEPQDGFYMDLSYRYPSRHGGTNPVTKLFVKSIITQAPRQMKMGSTINVAGVAFSGAPDIATVDVSDDNGTTWKPAALGHEHDPHAWRLWSFDYVPRQIGTARLVARAIDSEGRAQPRDAVWNQGGYLHNGWHSVEIEVVP
jgi:sulfite oxidase